MDNIIPTTAPRVANQYFFGDRSIDENTFNTLSTLSLLSKAGIPDRMLYEPLMATLNPDPRQQQLEEMTLRKQALEEAAYLRELGFEDEAKKRLEQYYPGLSTSGSALSDVDKRVVESEISALEAEAQGLTGDKLRENILKQKYLKGGGTIPSGQDFRYDPQQQSAYLDRGYISPEERTAFITTNRDLFESDDFTSSLLRSLGLKGISDYMAAGDILNRRGRQYLNL